MSTGSTIILASIASIASAALEDTSMTWTAERLTDMDPESHTDIDDAEIN
jgi:hypothetical protein